MHLYKILFMENYHWIVGEEMSQTHVVPSTRGKGDESDPRGALERGGGGVRSRLGALSV